MKAKSVLVFTWHDYCDWLRANGRYVSEADSLDPNMMSNERCSISTWHKGLVEKFHPKYRIEFCDGSNGFIVFAKRSLK
jgi:hypothetical protein